MSRLNTEMVAFLRELQRISDQNHIRITENTAKNLMEVVDCIEVLIAAAEIIPTKNQVSQGSPSNVSTYKVIE